MPARMPDTLDELRALERRIEREWWWLNGAIHATAQVRAERSTGNLNAFREMQAQVREVDRLRVQIAMRIAAIEAPACQGIDQAISRQT
jgi:hypothetical protein